MMMIYKLPTMLLCAALALSGCTSKGEGDANPILTVGGQVFGAIKAQRGQKGRPPFVTVTAKQLDNTKIPALQVNILSRGGSDFLKRVSQRKDGHPGTVAVWRGSDGTQLFLRNGVVVGTRGIGGDIISSDANATVQAVSAARGGTGERRYYVSDGAYSDKEIILSCDIENLGRETTQVIHLTFPTVHLQETCIGGAGDRVRIVNEYWVQPKSGTVRRSKQWVGPLSGYFEMILLRN